MANIDRLQAAFLTATELPRAAAELGTAVAAMPMLGLAPRGDGHHVIVLPGLGAGDRSTHVLRSYLNRQGYEARPWEQGRNLGVRRMGGYDGLASYVRDVYQESGRAVSLIGWSLGGIYARTIAKMQPRQVRQVICLGSPIGGRVDKTVPGRVYSAISGKAIDPRVVERMIGSGSMPPPVPSTAIYSKSDGVVPWQLAREVPSEGTDNIEVWSSHIGLGANAAVLYAVADRLSQPEGDWKAFQRTGWKRSVFGPNLDPVA